MIFDAQPHLNAKSLNCYEL